MGRSDSQTLDELEGDLFSSLKPVNPNPQFVNKLQERLIINPRTVVEDTSRQAAALFALIAFICGLVIIVVLRLIWRLLGRVTRA